MRFFDRHPIFLRTSIVGNWPDRLNARYEAIIGANAERFKGARVLDLASHDGRWTFAALEAGAAHVLGVEAREDLVAKADANLAELGVARDRYTSISADVFERRDIFEQPFDIVLCLGFFYHTARHAELLALIRSTNARCVILDTLLTNEEGNHTLMLVEAVDNPANGIGASGVQNGNILVGVPTAGAVNVMLGHFGYTVQRVDWGQLLAGMGIVPELSFSARPENPVGDYARHERGTFVALLP